jgi:hypothetical protein
MPYGVHRLTIFMTAQSAPFTQAIDAMKKIAIITAP